MNFSKWFVLAFVCMGACGTLADAPASQPSEIIMDLKYDEGPLTGNEPGYNRWEIFRPINIYGNLNECISFYKDVQKLSPEVAIYNICFAGEYGKYGYIFVDFDGTDKIKSVYHDTNGNGKLDDGEKLSASALELLDKGLAYETGNFKILDDDNNLVPFRFLLENADEGGEPFVMSNPAGYFVGQTVLHGKKFSLYLFPDMRTHLYLKVGKSYYLVLPSGQKLDSKMKLRILTSKILIFDKFYSVNFIGYSDDGKTMKVKLTETPGPMSDFKIVLQGKKPLKFNFDSIRLRDKKGKTLEFGENDTERRLPLGEYKIIEAVFPYGKNEDYEYVGTLCDTDFFEVKDGKPCVLVVGKPAINIELLADNGNNRYARPILKIPVYPEDELNIYAEVTGPNGECFGEFRGHSSKEDAIHGKMLITDSAGSIKHSEDMYYNDNDGGRGYYSSSWQPDLPGKYTITVTLDTGPLMGEIKAEREITVLPSPSTSSTAGASATPVTSHKQTMGIAMLVVAGVVSAGCIAVLWWLRKKGNNR